MYKKSAEKPLAMGCLLLLLVGFSACATVSTSTVEVHQASEYRFFEEMEGLFVGVEPYFEEWKNKQVFGVSLISRGILPVFMVVENHSLSTYLLEKERISVMSPDLSKSVGATNVAYLVGDTKELETGWAVVGMVSPAAGILSEPFVETQAINVQKITQHLMKNELPDKTLFPNESSHGFIYLRVSNYEAINFRQSLVLMIKIENLSKGKIIDFKFNIP